MSIVKWWRQSTRRPSAPPSAAPAQRPRGAMAISQIREPDYSNRNDSLNGSKNNSMSLIEGKIAGIVLDRIRARRSPSPADSADRAEISSEAGKSVSIREVRIHDFEQVRDLNLRLGQGPDSVANWRRLWLENPALSDGKGESPTGW